MALIDVTELLTDPDFVDPIKVIQRVPIVNSFGENSVSETTISGVGSVQPASGRDLMRLPEEFRIANLSTFWFKGVIVSSAPGQYASILVFKNQRYQVKHIFDWNNFGQGWTEGACVAEAPAP